MFRHRLFLSAAFLALTPFPLSAFAQAAAPAKQNEPIPAAKAAPILTPYLLATDPVTGQPLGDKAVIMVHEGRELRFASQANADKFKTNPTQYVKEVDQKLVALQLAQYPLKNCIISDEKLGGMGKPIDLVYNNRLVRFCCEGCVDDFKKNPETALKKIDAAVIAQQKPTYAPKTCVVSGDKLGGEMGEPVDVVLGTQLVRLCCTDCLKELTKNPAAYLQKAAPAASGQKP